MSTTRDIGKRPHGDAEEGKRHGPVRTSTSRAQTYKSGDYHHHGGPHPQGTRSPSPTWGSSAGATLPEEWTTPAYSSEFRNQQGSILERLRAERGWDLKGSHTDSLLLSSRAEAAAWKTPGPQEQKILWLILKRLPGREGPPENSLRMEAWDGPFFFFFLTLLPPADPSLVGPISVTLHHTSSPCVPCLVIPLMTCPAQPTHPRVALQSAPTWGISLHHQDARSSHRQTTTGAPLPPGWPWGNQFWWRVGAASLYPTGHLPYQAAPSSLGHVADISDTKEQTQTDWQN